MIFKAVLSSKTHPEPGRATIPLPIPDSFCAGEDAQFREMAEKLDLADRKDFIRACLKHVNTPKRRIFFRHALPIFLEIHKVFLRQIGFAW